MSLVGALRSLFASRGALQVGNRVRIFGGYQDPPQWLNGASHVCGRVNAFIPSGGDCPDVVVELDEPVHYQAAHGRFVVMSLRYVGKRWRGRGTVHLELCDFVPEPKARSDRPAGEWIESHAQYEVTTGQG